MQTAIIEEQIGSNKLMPKNRIIMLEKSTTMLAKTSKTKCTTIARILEFLESDEKIDELMSDFWVVEATIGISFLFEADIKSDISVLIESFPVGLISKSDIAAFVMWVLSRPVLTDESLCFLCLCEQHLGEWLCSFSSAWS